jgi:hypothetical protein
MWRPGYSQPLITHIPTCYSRERHHCGEVWFLPIETPSHPSVEILQQFDRMAVAVPNGGRLSQDDIDGMTIDEIAATVSNGERNNG